MDYNTEDTDVPTIQIRAIEESHVASINIPTNATLKVDGVEVI